MDGYFPQPSVKLAVAGRKCVRFDAHVVQHADEEVGQRRVLSLVVCDVASVLVVAARQEDWQVSRVVGVCVAEIAAEQHCRVVEQRLAILPRFFQLIEQITEATYECCFDLHELRDSGRVLAMMRQGVVLSKHAFDVGDNLMVLNHNADDT